MRAEKMQKLQEKQAARAKEEKEKKKRMSLNVNEAGSVNPGPASPGLPASATAAKKEESGVNGAPLEKWSSADLKPGKQVLGDACFDLG